MPGRMKTVRFSKVVDHSGVLETHLVLIDPDPAKDRALQSGGNVVLQLPHRFRRAPQFGFSSTRAKGVTCTNPCAQAVMGHGRVRKPRRPPNVFAWTHLDGNRYVVHAEELGTAFLELEAQCRDA